MSSEWEVVRESPPKPHKCKLPNLFQIWNNDLGPDTVIECKRCGKRWVRGSVNFRWFPHQVPPPVPPQPPTGGFSHE